MTIYIVSSGDHVAIQQGLDKIIYLYIDSNEKLGFKVEMIYDRIGYDKLKLQLQKVATVGTK